MPFTDERKVRLRKNPIKNVICQFRFPALLEIEGDNPTDFQKKIRSVFVEVQSRTVTEDLPSTLPPSPFSLTTSKVHDFFTEDRSLVTTLTKNSVTVVCNNYDVWSDFLSKIDLVYQALVEIYNPNHFTRIGLRYINIISRSQLDLEAELPWKKLINPTLLGLMGDNDKSDFVEGVNSITRLYCPESDIKMQVQSGTYFEVQNSEESQFVLDIDTFTEKNIDKIDVMNVLHDLHQRPRGFLRYAVQDVLYEAMEPMEL